MIGVLLAEDEAVVCLDLEDALTEAGLTVLGSFSHCAAARAWLDQNTPDVALLDVMLADGRCIEIARVLARRGIPLVFLSGGMDHSDMRAEFAGAIWFEKPVECAWVVQVLSGLRTTPHSCEPVAAHRARRPCARRPKKKRSVSMAERSEVPAVGHKAAYSVRLGNNHNRTAALGGSVMLR